MPHCRGRVPQSSASVSCLSLSARRQVKGRATTSLNTSIPLLPQYLSCLNTSIPLLPCASMRVLRLAALRHRPAPRHIQSLAACTPHDIIMHAPTEQGVREDGAREHARAAGPLQFSRNLVRHLCTEVALLKARVDELERVGTSWKSTSWRSTNSVDELEKSSGSRHFEIPP